MAYRDVLRGLKAGSRLWRLRNPTGKSASRYWHLLILSYSFVRLDPDSSALGTVHSKISSLRIDNLMQEIDRPFVHSAAEANVQS